MDYGKGGCVFPVVILSESDMGQYRDVNHREDAPHFTIMILDYLTCVRFDLLNGSSMVMEVMAEKPRFFLLNGHKSVNFRTTGSSFFKCSRAAITKKNVIRQESHQGHAGHA